MTAHVHTWQPIPELCARYSCNCGTTGYRNGNGEIVEHRQRRARAARPTVGRSASSAWVRHRIKKDYYGE